MLQASTLRTAPKKPKAKNTEGELATSSTSHLPATLKRPSPSSSQTLPPAPKKSRIDEQLAAPKNPLSLPKRPPSPSLPRPASKKTRPNNDTDDTSSIHDAHTPKSVIVAPPSAVMASQSSSMPLALDSSGSAHLSQPPMVAPAPTMLASKSSPALPVLTTSGSAPFSPASIAASPSESTPKPHNTPSKEIIPSHSQASSISAASSIAYPLPLTGPSFVPSNGIDLRSPGLQLPNVRKRFKPLTVILKKPVPPVSSTNPPIQISSSIIRSFATQRNHLYLDTIASKIPIFKPISLPPGMRERKKVDLPRLSRALSQVAWDDLPSLSLVSRAWRYSSELNHKPDRSSRTKPSPAYLSAAARLQREFPGKRTDEILAKHNQKNMNDFWPYLRSRRREIHDRQQTYAHSFLADLFSHVPPISKHLWTNPDHEEQITIVLRYPKALCSYDPELTPLP